ncbi:hypothetical protein [Burkholderia mayonis]|uniref:hypothetical protein n=1 Tax=Burkholderia mayonis TaxID=1385591 RepID=UPI00131EF218|nr:hypothetical protein [Burkholderia mayonis]
MSISQQDYCRQTSAVNVDSDNQVIFILSGRMLLHADSNERCPTDRTARATGKWLSISGAAPGFLLQRSAVVACRDEARIRNADDSTHRVFSAARYQNMPCIPIRAISRHFLNNEKFDVDLKNQDLNANQSVLLLPLDPRTSRRHFGAPTNDVLLRRR